MVARALDLDRHQVGIDVNGNEGAIGWQHRLLLINLEGCTWIGAAPTLEVQVVDLSEHGSYLSVVGRRIRSTLCAKVG